MILPSEVWGKILSYLLGNHAFIARFVCKKWHGLVLLHYKKWACEAFCNNLNTLKWARSIGCPWGKTLQNAGAHETTELIEWASAAGCPGTKNIYSDAAYYGRLENIKLLYSRGFSLNSQALSFSIGQGHRNCVDWLREKLCPHDSHTCEGASEVGDLEMVKTLIMESNNEEYIRKAYEGAVKGGHIYILDWLFDNENALPDSLEVSLYYCTNLEVYKWLKMRHFFFPIRMIEVLIGSSSPSIDIIKWLHLEGNIPLTSRLSSTAVYLGHKDILLWLFDRKCPKDENFYVACAAEGLTQYLSNHPPSDTLVLSAAHRGQLATLKWLIANGHPWHKDTMYESSTKYIDIIEWASEQGCPWDKEQLALSTVKWGNPAVLKWLKLQGVDFSDEKYKNKAKNHMNMNAFQWLNNLK